MKEALKAAFAPLALYLAGVAVCYAVVAFISYEMDPLEWGLFGRFAVVAIWFAWTLYFINSVSADDVEPE